MKVWLRTFGCRANQYDTEAVRELLVDAGHTIVPDASDAELAVFNSCAVTSQAEADLRQSVRRAARENPALRSAIVGCASALPGADARLRALPGVETVVPGGDPATIAAALGLPPRDDVRRTISQHGTRATLRIQDGCDEHCTFCATTMARGAARSRAVPELVAEATALAERHPEIVLTGIHVGSYGVDIGLTLSALVERLIVEVPAVRFRLTSVEATEVDERLGELLVGAPGRLAPHLHAPLQSGSDRVLRRMGRHWYNAGSYARALESLAVRAAVFAAGADVIAGFPGETEDEHRETLRLVGRLPLSYLHVFPYSPRPGTAATRLPDPLPAATVSRRAAELREAGARLSDTYRRRRDGGTADVVVIGEGSHREGLTEDYLSVLLPAPPPPRGDRFAATLRGGADDPTRLHAVPASCPPSTSRPTAAR